MSVFSLKVDIAQNRFFNGETSPLFSRAEAQKARAFHKKSLATVLRRCMPWMNCHTCLALARSW